MKYIVSGAHWRKTPKVNFGSLHEHTYTWTHAHECAYTHECITYTHAKKKKKQEPLRLLSQKYIQAEYAK